MVRATIAQGLEALRGQVSSTNQGRMYEVAIHADPERFLDWDKPLSAQRRLSHGRRRLPQLRPLRR
jgi:hypothetical protein